ncbi:hypothetical protein HK103_001848 [Boothiomyces macroporosus]|uniref:Clathrin-coated vesicle protein n=1 Tax=Boothiomyces macroporosus TaxID=261099 RepID=A0AAD5UDK0_9FUNG|nr:hypothetical protein HK103_001848 [Boothiomyces macroporosus]
MSDSFTFDEQKLFALDTLEKKELYLFQWLSTLEKDLLKLTFNQQQQQYLESVLMLYLTSNIPLPNRPTRHLIANCLNTIYRKGDTRTLFDTLSKIQQHMNSKKLDDPAIKIALIHCIGSVSLEHGSKVMSLFAETCSIFQKVLKYAKDADVNLRYETLIALGNAVRGAGRGANDATVKELVRLANKGISDKLPIIRKASCKLLEAVYLSTSQQPPMSIAEFDYVITGIIKYSDASTKQIRNSISSLVANILQLSQKIVPAPKEIPQPDRPILTIEEMLSLLPSLFIKANNPEAKITIVESFTVLLQQLGVQFIEGQYTLICKYCFELAAHPKITQKNDIYLAQESSSFILRQVIGKNLTESGQIRSCKELAGRLSKWPAEFIPDANAILILKELGALIADLGPAAVTIQDDILEPLLNFTLHGSYQVKLQLALCLRDFSLALPQHITKIMNKLIAAVQKELPSMNSDRNDTVDRVVSYGIILSSVIGIISSRSLYVAYEDAAIIFGLATQLLKSHVMTKDYTVMAGQAKLGWTLIGSLMSLGPNFVRVHVSQLLLIWKGVFPKQQPKDVAVTRTEIEWNYLLTSRESALAALESFLIFNSKELVTGDVAKRIVVSLNNTMQFLVSVNGGYGPIDDKPATPAQQKLYKKECQLRQRLFHCFKLVTPPSIYDSIYTPLVKASIDAFAMDPDKPDRFLATLGTKDGALFGTIGGKDTGALVIESVVTTSLLDDTATKVAVDSGAEDRLISKTRIKDSNTKTLDELIEKKVIPALENDPHCVYLNSKPLSPSAIEPLELPVPSNVALVDSAIELFALLFPLQNAQSQETLAEQLIKSANHQGGRITPIRKAACQINSLVAAIGCLKYISAKKGNISSQKILVAFRDLVSVILDLQKGLVKSSDPLIRTLSCDIIGRVARVSGNAQFINPIIQEYVDLVVNNRDPDVRAGASLALGSINHFVGGMAAGSHLRTVVGILNSLASDSHPLVHTWALHSLWLTIESAGLMYGPFVNSTLSMIAKLYMTETHEPSASCANIPGIENNEDVYPAFGKILHALLGVIGPELQDSSKIRDICFNLFEQLKNDENPSVVVEAIKCIQNFIMFAPKYVDVPTIIPFLQSQLTIKGKSQSSLIRTAAVTCLYQLTRRDPGPVLGAALNNTLEEQLFALFDVETDISVRDEIRDILKALLLHVAPEKPSRWIELCKNILSKNSLEKSEKEEAVKVEVREDNDEGEGEGESEVPQPRKPTATAQPPVAAPTIQVVLLPRWRTQVFALGCLRDVLQAVLARNFKEDTNLLLARKVRALNPSDLTKSDYLVFKLGDLIRLAFNSSTGSVIFLRMVGLQFLKDVLEIFQTSPDPEFAGHSILEQYEAQIISALAPAFYADAYPELISKACEVCAYFLGSKIVEEVTVSSRAFKLLSSQLEQLSGSEIKTAGRTPNAQVMVKLAVLAGWASFYLAIPSPDKITELFDKHLDDLVRLWLATLKDFALLEQDTEVATGIYSNASKDITLPLYRKSSHLICNAVTQVISTKLEKLETFPNNTGASEPTITKEFYTVIGICTEYLASVPSSATGNNSNDGGSSHTISFLKSIGNILTPRVIGDGTAEVDVLIEVLGVFDKLAQTEEPGVQIATLAALSQMLAHFATILLSNSESASVLKVTRIVYNTIACYVPGLSTNPTANVACNKPLSNEGAQALFKALELFTFICTSTKVDIQIRREMQPIFITIILALISTKKIAYVSPQALPYFKLTLQTLEAYQSEYPDLKTLAQSTVAYLIEKIETLLDDSTQEKDTIPLLKNLTTTLVLVLTTCPNASYQASLHQRLYSILSDMCTCNESDVLVA